MRRYGCYEGDDDKNGCYRKENLLRGHDDDRKIVNDRDGRGWDDGRFMNLVRVC